MWQPIANPNTPVSAIAPTVPAVQPTKLKFTTRLERFEHAIERNEFDVEAWLGILQETKDYDRFLKKFPTATKYWLDYVNTGKNIEFIFESCLQSGVDIRVWRLYIKFIQRQSDPETVQKTPYEQQQHMDTARKLFHKAISLPLTNIEELWRNYDSFETQLSRLTAKKFIADKSGVYMNARLCLKELQRMMDPIERLAGSYLPHPPLFNEKDSLLFIHWTRVLDWEEANSLALDQQTHIERMHFVYENCLLTMRHYSAIWIRYAEYLQRVGLSCDDILIKASQANPTWVETNMQSHSYEESAHMFTPLIAALVSKIESICQSYDKEIDVFAASLASTASPGSLTPITLDGESRQAARSQTLQSDAHLASLEFAKQMRLARRQSEKHGRTVFSAARKSEWITHHAHLAAAKMEYHSTRDLSIASRIYEIALKTFMDAPAYRDVAVGYLSFLLAANDASNARAVFERVVVVLSVEDAEVVWDMMMRFENLYGEENVFAKLDVRRREAYPGKHINYDVMEGWSKWSMMYSFEGLDSVSKDELGISKKKEASVQVVKVVHPNAKKDEKTPALESYDEEVYVRPDVGFYTAVKQDELKAMARNQEHVNVHAMSRDDGMSAASAGSAASGSERSDVMPAVVGWFLEKLGGSEGYNGPLFRSDDILRMLGMISEEFGHSGSSQFKRRRL